MADTARGSIGLALPTALMALGSWLRDDTIQFLERMIMWLEAESREARIARAAPFDAALCATLLVAPHDPRSWNENASARERAPTMQKPRREQRSRKLVDLNGAEDAPAPSMTARPVLSFIDEVLETNKAHHLVLHGDSEIETAAVARHVAARSAQAALDALRSHALLPDEIVLPVYAPLSDVHKLMQDDRRADLVRQLRNFGITDTLDEPARRFAAAIWWTVLSRSGVRDIPNSGLLYSRRLATLLWRQLTRPRSQDPVRLLACLDGLDRVPAQSRTWINRSIRAWSDEFAARILMPARATEAGDPLDIGTLTLKLQPFTANGRDAFIRSIFPASAAERLIAAWNGNARIGEWALSPSMAALISKTFDADGGMDLPAPSMLLTLILDGLLGPWNDHKRRDVAVKFESQQLSDEKRSALRSLARSFPSDRAIDGRDLRAILKRALANLSGLVRYLEAACGTGDVDILTDDVIEVLSDGVVVQRGADSYLFIHSAIHAHLRRESDRRTGPPPHWWPSGFDFRTFLEKARTGFVGREWLFREIDDWIRNRRSLRSKPANPHRALLIRGEFGVGKTALIAELVGGPRRKRVIAYHFCQRGVVRTLRPVELVKTIIAQLRETLPDFEAAVATDSDARKALTNENIDPRELFEDAILRPLAAIRKPSGPRLLVIDGLDEALELDEPTSAKADTIVSLLADIAPRLPTWLHVVATTRNITAVITKLGAAFDLMEIDVQRFDNQNDLDEIIRGRGDEGAVKTLLRDAGWSAKRLATELLPKCEGKILYAIQVLRDLESRHIDVSAIASLPPSMTGYYAEAFERRFKSILYGPVKELLGLLVVAQEPLTHAELAAISVRSEEEVLSQLQSVQGFLRWTKERCSFDHLSLAQWLRQSVNAIEGTMPTINDFAVDEAASKQRFIDWARAHIEAGTAHTQPYLLQHLAAHIVDEAERKKSFNGLLFDLRWLDAKLRTLGIDSLIAETAYLPADGECGLLTTALRNSANALRWDPVFLIAQLLGRLRDFDDSN